MRLFEKYAYRKLLKKAATVKRRVELPSLESIRKVGVLWQPGQTQAFQYLRDHFSHSQIIFRNLCVYPTNPVAASGASTSIITPKDINWLGFPTPVFAEDFIRIEFDLLLNISLEQTLVLDYLTALSCARFKIGWASGDTNFFDLNINIKGKEDSLYLAKQQIFYLGQFNKKFQYESSI